MVTNSISGASMMPSWQQRGGRQVFRASRAESPPLDDDTDDRLLLLLPPQHLPSCSDEDAALSSLLLARPRFEVGSDWRARGKDSTDSRSARSRRSRARRRSRSR